MKDILGNLFGFAVSGGIALKNFRFTIIYQGEDFRINHKHCLIEVPEDEVEVRNTQNKANYEDRKLKFTLLNPKKKFREPLHRIKAGDFVDRHGNLVVTADGTIINRRLLMNAEYEAYKTPVRDKAPLTESESFIKKVSETKYVGPTLAYLLQTLFSPSFGYIITAASSIAVFFTPLGPIVGAGLFAASLGALAFNIYRDVKKTQQTRDVQEEKLLLNKIDDARSATNKLIEQNPELARELGLKTATTGESINLRKHTYSEAQAASYIIAGQAVPNTIGLATTIASLNPVAILLQLLGVVTGNSQLGRLYKEYKDQMVGTINRNRELADKLGLPIANHKKDKPGMYNDMLADQCAADKAKLMAFEAMLKTDLKDYSDHAKANLFNELQLGFYEKLKEQIKPVERPGFLRDTINTIATGFTWTKINRNLNPMVASKEMLYMHHHLSNTLSMVDKIVTQTQSLNNAKSKTTSFAEKVTTPEVVKPASKVKPAAERNTDTSIHKL